MGTRECYQDIELFIAAVEDSELMVGQSIANGGSSAYRLCRVQLSR